MPHFPSLPEDAGVRHALTLHPEAGRALIHLHTAVLRSSSPLSVGEREWIAAYVSGLNACSYCHGVHRQTAERFGMDGALLEAMLEDLDTAPVPERLRPLLALARRLTLEPARVRAADLEAAFAAGWSERAVHDAIHVVCLFNYMNRLVEGHGIRGNAEIFDERGRQLAEGGYDPLLRMLGGDGSGETGP